MQVPYRLDTQRPKQVGLIVLQSDETLERDMRVLLPAATEFLVSRVPSGAEVTTESLAAMEAYLTGAASLLPRGAKIDVVGYGCTSATAQIGAQRVAQLVQAGVTTPTVTNPVTALIAACRHLGITRIALISPYIAQVSDRLQVVLAQAGIQVTAFASFNEPIEEKVVRINTQSITDAAVEIAHIDTCDAVFLSCTNLRTLDAIPLIEARIGKPVLSSNQVLAWHLIQVADLGTTSARAGMLFTE